MKKLFLYGAMATGLMLTACQSDDIVVDNNENARTDVDRTYYLKVNIHGGNDAFTRAAVDNGNPDANTDFANGVDNGTYNESKVSTVYFVFYDENGNVVGNTVQATPDWKNTTIDDETVENYGQAIVQVEVPKTSGDPTSVICYINPIAAQSLQFDLNTIQTVMRDRVWRSEYGFAMSNSVYYPDSNTDTEPRIEVPIEANTLQPTYEDAEKAETKAMDIYVERYAAKLSFNFDQATATIEDYETTSPTVSNDGTTSGTAATVSLKFNATRWALNAEALNTYMIKSFREESGGTILPNNFTFGKLNNIITGNLDSNSPTFTTGGSTAEQSGQWKWNNSAYHRSYWAMSPAYFTNWYPEVSSDVTHAATEGHTLLQKYYTYNELNTTGSNQAGFPLTTTTGYFKETTVGAKALTANNPKAAVASVILTGYYTVTVNGTALENPVTFYTYGRSSAGKDLVYFEAGTDGTSAVGAGMSMLDRFIAATSILYVKDINGEYQPATKAQIRPYVEIGDYKPYKDPSSDKESYTKVAARLRTLVLKSNVTTASSDLYIATGDGYKSIVGNQEDAGNNAITLDAANENIYQQVGTCAKYEDGKAYYNIPVMHYGWYRTSNTINQQNFDKNGLSGIEWSYVHVGDFGIVRNHSYNIKVTELKGIGTGIGDPTDPIVPPADTETYYVKYRVNILKWAVVPTQNVKL